MHVCQVISREPGFCAANDFAIACNLTDYNSFDNWLSGTQNTGIVMLLSYILQQKIVLEVSLQTTSTSLNKVSLIKPKQ